MNHQAWVPLELRASGYEPLEGVAVRVFGRLGPEATQASAGLELTVLAQREATAFPQTHEHLRPSLRSYGAQSPGYFIFDLALTHLPGLLVLILACTSVGTLFYARAATREVEIAIRYALGASRGRIVAQLFVEALVLASVAAVVGLTAAHWALKWGMAAFFAGQTGGPPFWIDPGLNLTTVLYAAGLALGAAAILGVLPALKAAGSHVQAQLGNLGTGGSTLRFGRVWSAAMITKVSLTVICIPPAIGIATEAVRDPMVRAEFPADQYLAVRFELDRDVGQTEESAFADRIERIYGEFERRVAAEPGVAAVTFGDRLPGMGVAARSAEVELSPDTAPIFAFNLWRKHVAPGYFETFERPILDGRELHAGDVGSRMVMVNEAFARRFTGGASPVGRRVRLDLRDPESWFEIVGMVSDMGMTPTDLGEASYVFHAASPRTVSPIMMGVRIIGDPAAMVPRVEALAADLDPGIRLYEVRPLDEIAWEGDLPNLVIAGALAGIVGLGLFLSGAGIFSLMSVIVSRRMREIGLRSALGASPVQLLTGVFSRALVLIGSGIVAGNLVLFVLLMLLAEPDAQATRFLLYVVLLTSAVMLTVGVAACVEPARRALRIQPADALKTV